jgi:anaerobic selenocysteine-containing dehydrogenase
VIPTKQIQKNPASRTEPEERVFRSACSQCWNGCGTLVYVKDGVITRILGDPDNPHNNGLICAKGQVGPQGIYSAQRVKHPLIRTATEKGLNVDPKWKEISWDEALDIVAANLKRVRDKDRRRFLFTSFDYPGPIEEYKAFVIAFDSPNFTSGSSDFFCGNSVHTMHYLNQAAIHGGVDFKYCRYILQIGTQWGAVVNTNVMTSTEHLADARASGKMKLVVVDPWASFAGSKADEWIPIRPGTDSAFILSLVNVMLNEIGKYDEPYLKNKTNAPYLVGPNGLYVRDPSSNKPLVWDVVDKCAKSYDDASVKDFALEGEYEINGESCKPGFVLLKEHVKEYSPEWTSEITTIPANVIRRIANEWVQEARIGENIEIDGYVLPYRPVAINWYRGASAHKHSALIGYAIMLLCTLVGAIDVPGGAMGEHRMAQEWVSEEGLLATSNPLWIQTPYPPRQVQPPKSVFFFELFPIGPYSPVMAPLTQLNPEKYKPPYKIEMLMQLRNNLVKSSGPTEMMELWIKQIDFVVSFSTILDETAQLSDLVIPDIYYLEREHIMDQMTHPGIDSEFYQYMQHQILSPPFDPPYNKITSIVDVLLELAQRAGFLNEYYDTLNEVYGQRDPFKLNHNVRYKWVDIADLKLRNLNGDEYGLEWFKAHQVLRKGPKDVQTAYPGAFRKARMHLYYEFIERAGAEVKSVTEKLGIPWDTSDYQALPDWKPCPSFNPRSKEFDLWIINSKLPTHTHTGSIYYPALLSVTANHKLDRSVLINKLTADKKGIKSGDRIVIETESGKKAKTLALVSEVCHPEVVVCFGNLGRRARAIPSVSSSVDFNNLLELDEEHIDFVNGALDSCIRVKVYKEA